MSARVPQFRWNTIATAKETASPYPGGTVDLPIGTPQSVFILNKEKLTQSTDKAGKPLRLSLSTGEVAHLPDGGTLQFVGLKQFVKFQFSSSPLLQVPLWGFHRHSRPHVVVDDQAPSYLDSCPP